jgi:uncharacterized membrane protein
MVKSIDFHFLPKGVAATLSAVMATPIPSMVNCLDFRLKIVLGGRVPFDNSPTLKKTMHNILPIGAAAATGFFVGAAIVATRFVIDQTTPVPLALMRYVIGFFCLLPPLLMSKRIRFDRRDLLPIGLLGIAQFGIVVVLLNYALQFIPAARAALLFTTFPLMTMVLSAFMGYEKITLPKTAGVMLTIIGVGLALGEKVFLVENSYATGWIGETGGFGKCAEWCDLQCPLQTLPEKVSNVTSQCMGHAGIGDISRPVRLP